MRDSRRAIHLAVYLSQTGRIRGSQAVSDTESAPICTGPHGVHKVSCAYFRCTATGVTFCTGLPGAHSSALDVERAEIPAENRAERPAGGSNLLSWPTQEDRRADYWSTPSGAELGEHSDARGTRDDPSLLAEAGPQGGLEEIFRVELAKVENLRKEAERAVPTASSLPLKRRERSEFRSGG